MHHFAVSAWWTPRNDSMGEPSNPVPPPKQLLEARIEAWRSLVDFGIDSMLALQRRLHPERDPREYVRRAVRLQAEDNHRANLRILERTGTHGR